MHITKIRGGNIKGFTFDHSLSPVTIITGENWSGKTSVIKALTLGLLGYDPAYGKQPGKSFQLCSADKMGAEITMDNGDCVRRFWNKKSDRISTDSDGGLPFEAPPILLDANEYFALSVEKRFEFVFSSIPLDGFAYPKVEAAIRNAIKFETNTEQTVLLTNTILDPVLAVIKRAPTPKMQEAILELLDRKIEHRKTLKQNLRSYEDGVNALNQLAQDETPLNLQGLEDEKASIDQTLGTVRQSRGQLLAKKQAQSEWRTRRDRLDNTVRNTQDCSDTIAKLKSDITTKEAELEEENKFVSQLADARAIHITRGNTLTNLQRDCTFAKEALTNIESEYAKRKAQPCCTECGNQGEAFSVLIEAYYPPKITAAKENIDKIVEKGKTARTEFEAAEKSLAIAKEADENHNRRLTAINGALRQLRGQLSGYEATQQSLDQAKRDITGLGEEDATDYNAQLATHDSQIQELTTKASNISELIKRATAQKQDELRRKQAIEKHDECKLTLEITNMIIDALTSIRAQMVEAGFGSILELANKIYTHVTPFKLECKDGAVGQWNKSSWAPYEAFSGAQGALAFAALSVSLATKSPFKLVILDEMTKLSPQNKKKLMIKILELVSTGAIHQFIGIDVDPTHYRGFPDPDFKLIEV